MVVPNLYDSFLLWNTLKVSRVQTELFWTSIFKIILMKAEFVEKNIFMILMSLFFFCAVHRRTQVGQEPY